MIEKHDDGRELAYTKSKFGAYGQKVKVRKLHKEKLNHL
jgi:hypothetical protein